MAPFTAWPSYSSWSSPSSSLSSLSSLPSSYSSWSSPLSSLSSLSSSSHLLGTSDQYRHPWWISCTYLGEVFFKKLNSFLSLRTIWKFWNKCRRYQTVQCTPCKASVLLGMNLWSVCQWFFQCKKQFVGWTSFFLHFGTENGKGQFKNVPCIFRHPKKQWKIAKQFVTLLLSWSSPACVPIISAYYTGGWHSAAQWGPLWRTWRHTLMSSS